MEADRKRRSSQQTPSPAPAPAPDTLHQQLQQMNLTDRHTQQHDSGPTHPADSASAPLDDSAPAPLDDSAAESHTPGYTTLESDITHSDASHSDDSGSQSADDEEDGDNDGEHVAESSGEETGDSDGDAEARLLGTGATNEGHTVRNALDIELQAMQLDNLDALEPYELALQVGRMNPSSIPLLHLVFQACFWGFRAFVQDWLSAWVYPCLLACLLACLLLACIQLSYCSPLLSI